MSQQGRRIRVVLRIQSPERHSHLPRIEPHSTPEERDRIDADPELGKGDRE
jgi:hypothetical protein